MINCNEAKKISLVSILDKIGAKKIKQNNREVWYISPFRNETTASFKIDLSKNVWFDHGKGKGGNVLDFIMVLYKCDLKEALRILDNESFSFHQHILPFDTHKNFSTTQIIKVIDIQHPALIDYCNSRRLPLDLVNRYCKEIHYKNESRTYFVLAFKNHLGGYEARSKYFKGCLLSKSYTLINNYAKKIIVLEGWIDFISLLCIYPMIEKKFDFIVLNSVSNKESIHTVIKKYEKIYLSLDNDKSGDLATKYYLFNYPKKTKDIRYIFKDYKDLNDYITYNNF